MRQQRDNRGGARDDNHLQCHGVLPAAQLPHPRRAVMAASCQLPPVGAEGNAHDLPGVLWGSKGVKYCVGQSVQPMGQRDKHEDGRDLMETAVRLHINGMVGGASLLLCWQVWQQQVWQLWQQQVWSLNCRSVQVVGYVEGGGRGAEG